MTLTTIALATALILVTILLFQEITHGVLTWTARSTRSVRTKTMVAVPVFFAAHNAAVWIFAFGFALGHQRLGLGGFAPGTVRGMIDYAHYSASAYTSLGLDFYSPTGGLRAIGGLEAVVGLMMITWTASATYVVLRDEARRR